MRKPAPTSPLWGMAAQPKSPAESPALTIDRSGRSAHNAQRTETVPETVGFCAANEVS
jgi:hypothetical protein